FKDSVERRAPREAPRRAPGAGADAGSAARRAGYPARALDELTQGSARSGTWGGLVVTPTRPKKEGGIDGAFSREDNRDRRHLVGAHRARDLGSREDARGEVGS